MTGPNLVPPRPATAPSYWCTWGLQNVLAGTLHDSESFGVTGHAFIANTLTEENLRRHAFDRPFLDAVRSDLYVLYDVGWDVPLHTPFDTRRWLLGSLEVAQDKFPSCAGSPVERLRKLDELTRKAGFRGAALWVPAHANGEGANGATWSPKDLASHFRVKLRQSWDAGIRYWKVDYGRHGGDLAFRRMITETAREVAPDLLVEHARNGGPLNDVRCPWDSAKVHGNGRFAEWGDGEVLKECLQTVQFSGVFRTYDVSHHLAVPTTLDRVGQLLDRFSGTGNPCILNCESEPYVGAVLGCALGVMSSVYANNIMAARLTENRVLDQVVRAVRWQRLAPPWGVGIGWTALDELPLSDTWDFRKGSDWIDYLDGSVIGQGAPSRIARDVELPRVSIAKGNEAPYVLASQHPNGMLAIGTQPRVSNEREWYYPAADVTITVPDRAALVGVFGRFGSLTLKLDGGRIARSVWAQDLASDEAVDIASRVEIHADEVRIPGAVFEEICGSKPSHEDNPGVVLRIE